MSANTCPDLEQLFVGLSEGDEQMLAHLERCPGCAEIIEEHRQLEKDLLRISDPLPPPDFVHLVMAKVEQAPVPLRREVWTGLAIFGVAVAAMLAFVLGDAATAGAFGTNVAAGLLSLRDGLAASGAGLKAIWTTAALPVTAAASVILVFVLFAFRRLAAPTEQPRVSV